MIFCQPQTGGPKTSIVINLCSPRESFFFALLLSSRPAVCFACRYHDESQVSTEGESHLTRSHAPSPSRKKYSRDNKHVAMKVTAPDHRSLLMMMMLGNHLFAVRSLVHPYTVRDAGRKYGSPFPIWIVRFESLKNSSVVYEVHDISFTYHGILQRQVW